jgi:oxygen-independent coproporphyrinogen-3 oxidase
MAGIYIHIPFCKQACHYCDFHFSTSLANKSAFVNALKKEILLRKKYLEGQKIETVYFGGGTPSLLSAEEILDIFSCLQQNFDISSDAEVTLEANPDDLTESKLKELKDGPVNRLSIGIQSFRDEDLKFMNRAHTAAEAERCVKQARGLGFHNITVDLIYGLPQLDEAAWRDNLRKAFALDIQHVSAYCLTVEPRTALAKFVKEGKVPGINDERSAEQFRMMKEEMRWNDFMQYEIANFGKAGFFSRHNSNYWKGVSYLGLGPSAHSFNGVSRQWNKPNNASYILSLEQGPPEFELEMLSPIQQYNEYVMTSLRTMWGCDLDVIGEKFGVSRASFCNEEAEYYLQSGKLVQKGNLLILSEEGMLFADRIASDLFASPDPEKAVR